MGLEFKFQFTGYGGLGSQLQGFLAQEVPAPWQT
jgi:hypothetical protein